MGPGFIERLLYGLKVSVIGMSVTFIGLIALVALVHINKFIAESVNKVGKAGKEKPAEPVKTVETQKNAAAAKPAATNDDGVIAAITAAVDLMMEGKAFRVKSVKKSQAAASASAWDMVAISEQNNNL